MGGLRQLNAIQQQQHNANSTQSTRCRHTPGLPLAAVLRVPDRPLLLRPDDLQVEVLEHGCGHGKEAGSGTRLKWTNPGRRGVSECPGMLGWQEPPPQGRCLPGSGPKMGQKWPFSNFRRLWRRSAFPSAQTFVMPYHVVISSCHVPGTDLGASECLRRQAPLQGGGASPQIWALIEPSIAQQHPQDPPDNERSHAQKEATSTFAS